MHPPYSLSSAGTWTAHPRQWLAALLPSVLGSSGKSELTVCETAGRAGGRKVGQELESWRERESWMLSVLFVLFYLWISAWFCRSYAPFTDSNPRPFETLLVTPRLVEIRRCGVWALITLLYRCVLLLMLNRFNLDRIYLIFRKVSIDDTSAQEVALLSGSDNLFTPGVNMRSVSG